MTPRVPAFSASVPNCSPRRHHLTRIMDTRHEWIVARPGIEERRELDPENGNAAMVTRAVRAALADAGVEAGGID